MTLAIVVHGGAKTVSEDKITANHSGCLAAVEAGWAYNSPDMAVAYMTAEMDKAAVFTKKEAENDLKPEWLQCA